MLSSTFIPPCPPVAGALAEPHDFRFHTNHLAAGPNHTYLKSPRGGTRVNPHGTRSRPRGGVGQISGRQCPSARSMRGHIFSDREHGISVLRRDPRGPAAFRARALCCQAKRRASRRVRSVSTAHAREPTKCNESFPTNSAAFPHAPRRYFSVTSCF